MTEEKKPDEEAKKPETAADKYADFIGKQKAYHSIFQSDGSGVSNRDIGISTGKISKDD